MEGRARREEKQKAKGRRGDGAHKIQARSFKIQVQRADGAGAGGGDDEDAGIGHSAAAEGPDRVEDDGPHSDSAVLAEVSLRMGPGKGSGEPVKSDGMQFGLGMIAEEPNISSDGPVESDGWQVESTVPLDELGKRSDTPMANEGLLSDGAMRAMDALTSTPVVQEAQENPPRPGKPSDAAEPKVNLQNVPVDGPQLEKSSDAFQPKDDLQEDPVELHASGTLWEARKRKLEGPVECPGPENATEADRPKRDQHAAAVNAPRPGTSAEARRPALREVSVNPPVIEAIAAASEAAAAKTNSYRIKSRSFKIQVPKAEKIAPHLLIPAQEKPKIQGTSARSGREHQGQVKVKKSKSPSQEPQAAHAETRKEDAAPIEVSLLTTLPPHGRSKPAGDGDVQATCAKEKPIVLQAISKSDRPLGEPIQEHTQVADVAAVDIWPAEETATMPTVPEPIPSPPAAHVIPDIADQGNLADAALWNYPVPVKMPVNRVKSAPTSAKPVSDRVPGENATGASESISPTPVQKVENASMLSNPVSDRMPGKHAVDTSASIDPVPDNAAANGIVDASVPADPVPEVPIEAMSAPVDPVWDPDFVAAPPVSITVEEPSVRRSNRIAKMRGDTAVAEPPASRPVRGRSKSKTAAAAVSGTGVEEPPSRPVRGRSQLKAVTASSEPQAAAGDATIKEPPSRPNRARPKTKTSVASSEPQAAVNDAVVEEPACPTRGRSKPKASEGLAAPAVAAAQEETALTASKAKQLATSVARVKLTEKRESEEVYVAPTPTGSFPRAMEVQALIMILFLLLLLSTARGSRLAGISEPNGVIQTDIGRRGRGKGRGRGVSRKPQD
ncbi:hypothetical protein HK101_008923 [Irineochytrium annulatum]|nr:hypothetical protein HK101_008923 [Irineochytrium annulatum]